MVRPVLCSFSVPIAIGWYSVIHMDGETQCGVKPVSYHCSDSLCTELQRDLGTPGKNAQNWTFVKNTLRKSAALFISHCFGHCPPPSHPKQCWKRLQWFWVWRALQINIALGVEGGCANLRCFWESVPRLLARIVGHLLCLYVAQKCRKRPVVYICRFACWLLINYL